MGRQRIEKTLIILDEEEVRQVLRLASQDDARRIYAFVKDVLARKVEAALRQRCE
jgi:hypothetical protein